MTNFFRTVLAAGLLMAGAAQADETKIITIDLNSPSARAQVVQTAADVCRAALQKDYFGDFGSFEECVQDTVAYAHPRQASAQSVRPQQTAQVTSSR
jgi:hypothetical protein